MDDESIVKLYLLRSEDAIAETERKYGRYLESVAYRILGDREDAKEILNDTFMKVWSTVPPNKPSSLKIYAARISRQLAINRAEAYGAAKRAAGELPLLLDELEECIPDTSSPDISESLALRDQLSRFVRSLASRERKIFVKRYFWAMTVAEIAKELRTTEGAVAAQLYRTRRALAVFLEKEGFNL